jgi:hypothetical protein
MDAPLALGALAGALLGGLLSRPPRLDALIAGLAAWLVIGDPAGGVPNLPLAVADTFSLGVAIGFAGVFGISWGAAAHPAEMLSRVASVDMLVGYRVDPVSLIVTGALAGLRREFLLALMARSMR